MDDNTIDVRSQYEQITQQDNATFIDNLGEYLSNVVGFALIIAGILFFGYLVLGGIMWLTSGSDTNKVDEAKKHLTNALIGLAIVASSWAVFLVADEFFGLGIAETTNSTSTTNPPNTRFGGYQEP